MDHDFVPVRKNAKKKKELGQYPVILAEQVWSITHIIYWYHYTGISYGKVVLR